MHTSLKGQADALSLHGWLTISAGSIVCFDFCDLIHMVVLQQVHVCALVLVALMVLCFMWVDIVCSGSGEKWGLGPAPPVPLCL